MRVCNAFASKPAAKLQKIYQINKNFGRNRKNFFLLHPILSNSAQKESQAFHFRDLEKAIGFCLRKGKAGGEPSPTETKTS